MNNNNVILQIIFLAALRFTVRRYKTLYASSRVSSGPDFTALCPNSAQTCEALAKRACAQLV